MDGHTTGAVAGGARLIAPEDWRPWISYIKGLALVFDMWHEIDPEQPTEYIAPTAPRKPRYSDIRQGVNSPIDFTNDEATKYRDLIAIYADERAEFQSRADRHQKLMIIIQGTVGSRYQSYLIGQHTVYHKLRALYELFQSSDRTQIQILRQKWQDTLQRAPDQGNAESWLSEINLQYLEGVQAGVPEIKHRESAIFDILKALRKSNPSFCEIWFHEVFDKARKIEVPQLVRAYIGQASFQQLSKSNISNASFSTFQGFPEGDKQRCVCGRFHAYTKCFYLNKAIRPKDYEIKDDITKKIRERLEDQKVLSDVQAALPGFYITDLPSQLVAQLATTQLYGSF